MGRLTDESGTTSIFLIVILTVLVSVILVFLNAAERIAAASMSQAYINLAGRSVLSEFNRDLKEDYGLFATGLQNEDIIKRMAFYLACNLPQAGLVQMELTGIQTDVSDYSLAGVDNFEQQVLEAGKFVMGQTGGENAKEIPQTEGRQLKNKVVLNNLPSAGTANSFMNIDLLSCKMPSMKEILKGTSDKVLINEYILHYFKHAGGSDIEKPTFFQREAEYILYGRHSDKENMSRLKFDYIAARTILNLLHIKSDPGKMEELMAMASVLTPGPEAAVTQLVLAGVWAGLEAENDWNLIEAGYGVAPIKGSGDWALTISVISRGYQNNGYVRPKQKSDFTYDDYLRVFLYFENRETKLLRMMDLIQINMIGRSDGNFLVKDHYVGFGLEAVINDKEYSYEQIY